MKKVILWAIVLIAFFAALIIVDKPDQTSTNALTSTQKTYDFGTISMKDGKVKHIYQIKNDSDKTLTVTKLYTSCMCTTAELTVDSQKAGPFGMQGHGGSVPGIHVPITSGQTAEVEVIFDPAAHGSTGVGDIKRSIFVSTQDNPNFELTFKATVRP